MSRYLTMRAALATFLLAPVLWTGGPTAIAPARAQSPGALNSPVPAATSENARDVLARVRPSIVQIKGFFGSNTAHEFHGTGFAVAAGGVFMTNYHVVARKVQHPTRYRLEFRTTDDRTGPLEVLAVDVRHDLALVKAVGHAPPPLAFVTSEPERGTRAYAVGFPLDVGLTITEGVSNGMVEESFEPRIHYSGAINGGMSGGPAFDQGGKVIGVNVSHYRFQQLVSFLVPAKHVRALAEHIPAKAPTAEALNADIAAQARAHARHLLGSLAGPLATQTAAGYALPGKLAPFMQCSGSGNPDPLQPVQSVRINCQSKAGLFLRSGLQSGDLHFSHAVLSTEKLDAWRFTHRLSANAAGFGAAGLRREVGPYACRNRTVALKGFDAAVSVCTRGYRKLADLYDFFLVVRSLNGTQRGFTSRLTMTGMEFEPAMTFIERFVAAMEWKP
ncbi:MAG: serine protease [Hyphomicrobiaceae bacterium]